MAALRTVSSLSTRLLTRNQCLLYSVRHSHQEGRLPDGSYAPAPEWPKTREELEKAAAKYHLHPDEYVQADDYFPGDYPHVPHFNEKDPWYPWDIPALRKQYKEVINVNELNPSTNIKFRVPLRKAFLTSAGIMLAFSFIVIFGEYQHRELMEKQYVHQGKVHYTFEPKE